VPHQYLVAVCDILGFSNLVEQNPLDQVVDGALGWFRRALHHSIHKDGFPPEVPHKAETDAHEHVGVAWFSDTVLLYSLRDDDEAARQLIMTVGWLIFETLLSSGRTKIRGGISYGEARMDRENSIFVGKAIVDAYRLEKRQEWSGAALTETACDRIPEYARSGGYADWWVIPYGVPLKDGLTTNTLAINWTWGIHHPPWLRWSESAESPTDADWQDKPDICRKFINTKAFHDALCHHCNPRSRVGLGA
jgi:hypothetical protein